MNFLDFARVHGVDIPLSKFHPSDRIKRCGTVSKPRSNNGAFFWDGRRGWVMDWSQGEKPIWFNDPDQKPFTDEEKRDWFRQRAKGAEEIQVKYRQAAEQAEQDISKARLDHHDYLKYKGFPDEFGLCLEDRLLIPMRNWTTNKVQGYQQIYSDQGKWHKKMLYGMKAKDAVLALGPRTGEVWLVEGYATALSVRAALRQARILAGVICCFSANNLVQIAKQASQTSAFVFADNDESKKGEEAAVESFLPWTMADTVGWDANDLHQKEGLFAVIEKIMRLRADYL
jgi:putative DNA primase/helicase